MEMTLGEFRIRTQFNVNDSADVERIKLLAADLINAINELKITREVEKEEFSEFERLKSLGKTAAEEAAMWGVKAATF